MCNTTRYCLAVDLKDDPELIEEYKAWHTPQKAWPQITQNMRENDIIDMEIYLLGDRLFMIMETGASFDPNKIPSTDEGRQKEEEWQTLMWKFQKPLKWAKPGEKWVKMEKIYDLKNAL